MGKKSLSFKTTTGHSPEQKEQLGKGSEKRKHATTGDTAQKPEEKKGKGQFCTCSTKASTSSTSKKRLSFKTTPGHSPNQKGIYKEVDANLPFYYYTLNDRFKDEELPSFDECSAFDEDQIELRIHPLRLHRLMLNQRELRQCSVCCW